MFISWKLDYVNKINCNFTKKACKLALKRLKIKSFVGITKEQNASSKTPLVQSVFIKVLGYIQATILNFTTELQVELKL